MKVSDVGRSRHGCKFAILFDFSPVKPDDDSPADCLFVSITMISAFRIDPIQSNFFRLIKHFVPLWAGETRLFCQIPLSRERKLREILLGTQSRKKILPQHTLGKNWTPLFRKKVRIEKERSSSSNFLAAAAEPGGGGRGGGCTETGADVSASHPPLNPSRRNWLARRASRTHLVSRVRGNLTTSPR